MTSDRVLERMSDAELYTVAFYLSGMVGGLLALSWFVLVARRFFMLARTGTYPGELASEV